MSAHSADDDLMRFVQEKQKTGRINPFQGNYIFEQSLTAGRDVKETLEEFNLHEEFAKFCLDNRTSREQERAEQERSYQLTLARDKLKKLKEEIPNLQVQIDELNGTIEPQLRDKEFLEGRLKAYGSNPRFEEKLKELDREMAPVKEKIMTLQEMIEEKTRSLVETETMIQTLIDD